MNHIQSHYQLNTQGLICPEPIMLLHQAIRKAKPLEIIHIIANDPATTRDIPNFCNHLGHPLLQQHTDNNPNQLTDPDVYDHLYHFWVQKKAD